MKLRWLRSADHRQYEKTRTGWNHHIRRAGGGDGLFDAESGATPRGSLYDVQGPNELPDGVGFNGGICAAHRHSECVRGNRQWCYRFHRL